MVELAGTLLAFKRVRSSEYQGPYMVMIWSGKNAANETSSMN
jgi:hypothetical protein